MSKNSENAKKDGFKMYLESENLSANTIRAYLAATGAHVRLSVSEQLRQAHYPARNCRST